MQYPPAFLEGIKEFYNKIPDDPKLSDIKNYFGKFIQSEEQSKSVISMVTDKMAGKVETICVDEKRKIRSWIKQMLVLMMNINLIRVSGIIGTEDVYGTIRDEMGTVSLKELGVPLNLLDEELLGKSVWEAPLYEVVKEVHESNSSRLKIDTLLKIMGHIEDLIGQKEGIDTTSLEGEAIEAIQALEGKNTPKKVVSLVSSKS